MKNTIINLYNRDYLTFYLIIFAFDLISYALFHFPLFLFIIVTIQITLTLTNLLRKFKK